MFYMIAILEGNNAAGLFVSGLTGTPIPGTIGEWRLTDSVHAEPLLKNAAEGVQVELEKLGFKTELRHVPR